MLFTSQQKKIICLTSLGGALEFYDFVIFLFFSKTLSTLFFPSTNSNHALIASLALFAVGYLARPLGGLALGHLGDRSGRKKPFILALIGMTIPSLLIGVLPGYQTIGMFAPIALVCLRLVQGFSLGGEIPGALVFITELTPTTHRALVCALIFTGINLGALLASLVVNLLSHTLQPAALLSWGWRLSFCLGGLLGAVSYYLRRQLYETPLFLDLKKQKKLSYLPIKQVVTKYPIKMLQGALLASLNAVITSLFFLFMPTYLNTFFNYPFPTLIGLHSLLTVYVTLISLGVAYLADKWGYLTCLRFGSGALLLLGYPLYSLFAYHSFPLVVLSELLLVSFGAIIFNTFPSILVGLYPTEVRFTGVALAYNLGYSLAGGLTPLCVMALIHFTGNTLAPSGFLILFALFAWIASFFMTETRGVSLKTSNLTEEK